MISSSRRGVFWFRQDLRLHDNPALIQFIANVDEAQFVYIIDPRWFKSSHFQSAHMGKFRWHFLLQTLQELSAELRQLGQELRIFYGEPTSVMQALLVEQIATVATTRLPGVYEQQQWQNLQDEYPHAHFIDGEGFTLFHQEQLPFALADLPANFTPFRKRVESIAVDPCIAKPERLPSPFKLDIPERFNVPKALAKEVGEVVENLPFSGGTSQGLKRLQHYLFDTQQLLTYKQTRNGMLRFDDSSKLSPWLANGALSVKQVYHEIKRFEGDVAANESTYWLYFELLWREYFQWYLYCHGSSLFRFHGVRDKKPMTSFWPERFAKWCSGNTPYPIVNACMNELNQTGFMSNRGRQLVASCLVHELQLDWRYGAAYFEQQLVDFDVASNWGNWQYLAGVGADPRGHRRFDLEKQANTYDPQGDFVRHWQGNVKRAPLDSSDMVDWPILWQ